MLLGGLGLSWSALDRLGRLLGRLGRLLGALGADLSRLGPKNLAIRSVAAPAYPPKPPLVISPD